MRKLMLRSLLLVAMAAPALLFGDKVDVNILGVKVGELNVNPYTDLTTNTAASLNIQANFTKANQAAGGQALLDSRALLGTAFMQTVTFNMAGQQTIFFGSDKVLGDGTVLPNGTPFPDTPFKGYVLYDGSKDQSASGDLRPYYSDNRPSGVMGDVPPNYYNGNTVQFSDTPAVQWGDYNDGKGHTADGLANLLMGLNGSLNFETALVGVCQEPPLDNKAPSGQYRMCVLKDFKWGFNFTYVGPNGGRNAGNYVRADYNEANVPLTFANDVTGAFRGAYDQLGNNARLEWNANLIQADLCPEPAFILPLAAMLIGLVLFVRRGSPGTSLTN